jgi:hypothetical protein
MTNQHHIVPSPEQVDQWFDDAVQLNSTPKYYIARQAALWGADQELEACCQALRVRGTRMRCMEANQTIEHLRAARRPKPPSLKEQALEELRQLPIDPESGVCASALDTIRRALEALDD